MRRSRSSPRTRPPRKTRSASESGPNEVREALGEQPPPGRDCLRFPTFCKYQVMARMVVGMNVREKRNVFQHMRDLVQNDADGTSHMFLPWYGLTLGEFSIFQR
jgi:hypothetical protein